MPHEYTANIDRLASIRYRHAYQHEEALSHEWQHTCQPGGGGSSCAQGGGAKARLARMPRHTGGMAKPARKSGRRYAAQAFFASVSSIYGVLAMSFPLWFRLFCLQYLRRRGRSVRIVRESDAPIAREARRSASRGSVPAPRQCCHSSCERAHYAAVSGPQSRLASPALSPLTSQKVE